MDSQVKLGFGEVVKFVYSPHYEADIGLHVFPTSKYRLVRERLIGKGLAQATDFIEPQGATRQQLELVHKTEYLDDLESLRWTERTCHAELPLTEEVVDAYFRSAGGTILAAEFAAKGEKIVGHIGGGFHHAFPGHGEGFCLVNDVAIAIRVLQEAKQMQRFMIVDLDLHQGNGSAFIFRNDPDVFTLSLHQESTYPPKQASDLDIGIADLAGDEEYLAALQPIWPEVLIKHKPEMVMYMAGADMFQDDELGSLKMSFEGLKQRDRIILQETMNLNIPTVIVLAGGYARHLDDTVAIHTNTFEVATQIIGS
ncbi:histone deacetylase [candidate division BRC1 bacterium HGW-BRC1-1]|nr:MAG: histone deacetylase [candidate division BRC1 bacterium HGW-BRC1-1]